MVSVSAYTANSYLMETQKSAPSSNDVETNQFEELIAQSRGQLVEFLYTEVQLGFTFIDMAATERDFGNLDHFEHAKRDVKKAIDTIRHFLDRVENTETRAGLSDRCTDLERALAAFS